MQTDEERDLPEYDDNKRDESVLWQVYVLELEGGCFYVGIALDVTKRFQEHVDGDGANFTRLHKPLRIVEQICSGTCDMKKAQNLENQKTLEYALKYGGHKVKGGRFFSHSKLIRKSQHVIGFGDKAAHFGSRKKSVPE